MDIIEGSIVSWSHGHKSFPYVGPGVVVAVYSTQYGKAYDVESSGVTSHVTPNHPMTPDAFVSPI